MGGFALATALSLAAVMAAPTASASTAAGAAPPDSAAASADGLGWPIDCAPPLTCISVGFPDIDGDGLAFNCGLPQYTGHRGTDILITWSQMAHGVPVVAAADGEVIWTFDGKYDHCPDPFQPDCQPPEGNWAAPNARPGTYDCTDLGPYCGTGACCCFWCWGGGNLIVIRHEGVPGVFATAYFHLRRNSLLVSAGDFVHRGQPIALAGSSGETTWPHVHFEVWGSGYNELADPWAGPCGPNTTTSLWRYDPPYQQQTAACEDPDGDGRVGCSPGCRPAAGQKCGDNCPEVANPGQEDINRNGRGDACESAGFDLLDPPDGSVLPGLPKTPVFRWTPANRKTWRVEFSTTFDPFVPIRVPGLKKKLKTTLWTVDGKTWQALSALSVGVQPLYWRVAGKGAPGTPERVSDQVFSFTIQP